MTQPIDTADQVRLQAAASTMQEYLELLTAVNNLGIAGFARFLDMSTAPELEALSQSAQTILGALRRPPR